MKQCGTCTACCTLIGVKELDKPRGVACAHIEDPGRCGIYRRRPQSCRNFSCAWLLRDDLGGELRPDRCGAVFVFFAHTPKLMTVHVDPEKRFCWTVGPVKTVVSQALAAGNSVSITCGSRRFAMLPPTQEGSHAELPDSRPSASGI